MKTIKIYLTLIFAALLLAGCTPATVDFKGSETCLNGTGTSPSCNPCRENMIWLRKKGNVYVMDTLPSTISNDLADWPQYEAFGRVPVGAYEISDSAGIMTFQAGAFDGMETSEEAGFLLTCQRPSSIKGGNMFDPFNLDKILGGDSGGDLGPMMWIAGSIDLPCPPTPITVAGGELHRGGHGEGTVMTVYSEQVWSEEEGTMILHKYIQDDVLPSNARSPIGTKIVIVDNFKTGEWNCDPATFLADCPSTEPDPSGDPSEGPEMHSGSEAEPAADSWLSMCSFDVAGLLMHEECQYLVFTDCVSGQVFTFDTSLCPIRMEMVGENMDRVRLLKPAGCDEVACTPCPSNPV